MSDIITVDFKVADDKPVSDKILKEESIFSQECKHNKGWTLVEGENVVTCTACEKVLDPFWVFQQMQKAENVWQMRHRQIVKFNEEYRKHSMFKCYHCGKMSRTVKKL